MSRPGLFGRVEALEHDVSEIGGDGDDDALQVFEIAIFALSPASRRVVQNGADIALPARY
jgi:hypothetical protein